MTFNLEKFIRTNIIERTESYFAKDIDTNLGVLKNALAGKSILIIGGAGTIGSSFIKTILPFHINKLIVVDHNENGLTELTRDLRSSFNDYIPEVFITYPLDFGGAIFKKLYLSEKWDIVACFAAHKHVRSEKNTLTIEALIRNNVFNVKSLLELALKNPPQHFFSVSTDKAVAPANIMGASKRLMEKVLMSYSEDINVSSARFANVAFSNGSLLFGFLQRLLKQQPLSAPIDVHRYFISPEEAGELCLLACILGQSREILFPKLDESHVKKFSSIAEDLLLELGLEPEYCSSEQEAIIKAKNWTPEVKKYPVYFFNTRTTGEKKYESFIANEEQIKEGKFSALGIIKYKDVDNKSTIHNALTEIDDLFKKPNYSKTDILKILGQYITDFQHHETGKSLDQNI